MIYDVFINNKFLFRNVFVDETDFTSIEIAFDVKLTSIVGSRMYFDKE